MIKIRETISKERFNLVDTEKIGSDDYYIRQLSLVEVKELGNSIIELIGGENGK